MMVGIDILDYDDAKDKLSNEKFLKKYFTEYEIDYSKKTVNNIMRLAGIFCAKEAFLKALKIGIGSDIALKEIEIIHDNLGAPKININDKIKNVFLKYGVTSAEISISHSKTSAIAICILV